MRVDPIGVNIHPITKNNFISKTKQSDVSFQGKHDCAKLFGTIAAGIGTLGALGGIAIMTGGVSLIPTIAYGALCGGIGAYGGHIIDKSNPDYRKKNK